MTEPPQWAHISFKGPIALMSALVNSSGILLPFKNTGGINLPLDDRFLSGGVTSPEFIK